MDRTRLVLQQTFLTRSTRQCHCRLHYCAPVLSYWDVVPTLETLFEQPLRFRWAQVVLETPATFLETDDAGLTVGPVK
jgi:hypothetical protein